jgi:exodeoxyribonuclease VII large subunit
VAEIINEKTVFSLLEVTKSIQGILNDRYKTAFWVKADMNKLNFYKHSGHCYPELVEKKDGKIIAMLKAYMWKDDYRRINDRFVNVLHEPLKDGIKILFLAKISFEPAHGLSLWIVDIDPSYTMGDLEREKQATIRKLKSEGIFDKNKSLAAPLLPRRIAIISVETSKGYADFVKVIETNAWGYRFFLHLFPSLLQGDHAVQRIIEQLQKIKHVKHHFDVVAIIRGGGGEVGLSCFNAYLLAEAIALFPLPVITGIGHATNKTVTEMVAFADTITPTKLAEYLLQKFHAFAVPVGNAEKIISGKATQLLNEEKMKLGAEIKLFHSVTGNVLISNKNKITNLTQKLSTHAGFTLKNEKTSLEALKTTIAKGFAACCKAKQTAVAQWKERLQQQSLLKIKNALAEIAAVEKHVAGMNPENVLKRGYSITRMNGRTVTDLSQVEPGDVLRTTVHRGEIISVVKSTHKTIHNE